MLPSSSPQRHAHAQGRVGGASYNEEASECLAHTRETLNKSIDISGWL